MIGPQRRPKHFIIGAMKSGTTSLHEYLDSHPQIVMSEAKEPGYFVEEVLLGQGERWYLSLFAQDERFVFRGESSTHYTKLPVYRGVAERLHRSCPDARLIYIRRDPFERILSHYWNYVRDAAHGGHVKPLLKAVRERPDYLAFSDYAMQLKPYLDRFGPQAIYTFTFGALVANPQRELAQLCQWLGVPPAPFPHVPRSKGRSHGQCHGARYPEPHPVFGCIAPNFALRAGTDQRLGEAARVRRCRRTGRRTTDSVTSPGTRRDTASRYRDPLPGPRTRIPRIAIGKPGRQVPQPDAH